MDINWFATPSPLTILFCNYENKPCSVFFQTALYNFYLYYTLYFRYTVNEVESMLEDDNFLEAPVYLAPPGDGMEPDEDSDTEEGFSADHLSSHQLNAPAEFVINYDSDNVNSLDEVADTDMTEEQVDLEEPMDEGLEEPMTEEENGNPVITLSCQCPPTTDWKWLKKDLKSKMLPCQPTPRQFREPLTPMAIFNAFFDDDVVEYMV